MGKIAKMSQNYFFCFNQVSQNIIHCSDSQPSSMGSLHSTDAFVIVLCPQNGFDPITEVYSRQSG